MTQTEKDFARQMAIARERMDKYKVALSVLAQGENSLYMTDDSGLRLRKPPHGEMSEGRADLIQFPLEVAAGGIAEKARCGDSRARNGDL